MSVMAWEAVRAFGHEPAPDLADVLERVLDKGIAVAGDVSIDQLDVELLSTRTRLLAGSVDRTRELGIDWWEQDAGQFWDGSPALAVAR